MATPYSGNNRKLVGYGLTQALVSMSPQPIVAKRAPTTADSAQLGTVWVQPTTTAGVAVNTAWILTSIISNASNWEPVGGGAATFTSLIVNPGPTDLEGTFLSNAGTFTVTSGTNAINISADAAATAVNIATGAGVKTLVIGSTNTTSATTITSGSGNVNLAAPTVASSTLQAAGLYCTADAGGIALTVGLTTSINATQGAGTLSIKSTTGNAGNNTGFLKIYIGATTAYIPYFTNIAP